MTHVKDARDIGWGDDDRITGARVAFICSKQLVFFPESIPAFFNILGVISFIRLFHKRYLLLSALGIVINTRPTDSGVYKNKKGIIRPIPKFRTNQQ
jgi:hypothetical protein